MFLITLQKRYRNHKSEINETGYLQGMSTRQKNVDGVVLLYNFYFGDHINILHSKMIVIKLTRMRNDLERQNSNIEYEKNK